MVIIWGLKALVLQYIGGMAGHNVVFIPAWENLQDPFA